MQILFMSFSFNEALDYECRRQEPTLGFLWTVMVTRSLFPFLLLVRIDDIFPLATDARYGRHHAVFKVTSVEQTAINKSVLVQRKIDL